MCCRGWLAQLSAAGEHVTSLPAAAGGTDEQASHAQTLSMGVHEADDPVLEADANGVIVAVNAAVAEFTGYSQEELLGQHFHFLVPTDQAAIAALSFERKRKNPDIITRYRIDIQRKDGGRRGIEVTSRRVERPGSPQRMRGIWKTQPVA
jgi:PAS domain S-box-containing protein